mmetsp:Transcript_14970/g.46482  ORF Transcript_14970/g.46482 Transcript_14970/m.46482 type:complete len:136 (+) Transcript_14970:159-566(+)
MYGTANDAKEGQTLRETPTPRRLSLKSVAVGFVLGVVGTLVCVSVLGPHNDARDIMSMVDLDFCKSMVDLDFQRNNPNCGHFEVVCLELKDQKVCTNKMPRGCENDPACDDNLEYWRACCKGLYEPSRHIHICSS